MSCPTPEFCTTVVIENDEGFHLRPISIVAKIAYRYPCEILIGRPGHLVNARQSLEMMGLGIESGETVEILTRGDQAEQALNEVREQFLNRFPN
ncbi:HPr family phosphocarrier protein [Stratiformator vulcanicus]|uniref:Phosphocarrier protein HPr n=1 Tax=Stratiformator vulcanicus TaxID=2527980 RepID=A0A517R484_9PLAN|nr:HPr family phosphocarrier protein [Stratiformator vulcanicus]QDT38660.1 Phosphocarrier protein HPr [Stratiformator vulcanicus]